MRIRSIGFRLAAWYFLVFACGVAAFSVAAWFAVRASLYHAIDEALEDRVRGVKQFMDLQIASLSVPEIRDEFREHSVLGPGGDLFQVCDDSGQMLYRSVASFQVLDTVKFSGDADNVRYDGRDRRIIVGYGDGALGLLDPAVKKLGDIPLDAHPESFQLEKTGSRAFVNVPDRKQIEVVDLVGKRVVGKWPVTSALKNYPMALDETHHRLLVGCRAPARMLVLDTESGRQTASIEIVGDTDDLFYDAARNRVYVIGGDGFIDVFAQQGADQYQRIEHIATAPGARTGLFVPDWGKLFVAVPHRGEQRAEVLIYETN